VSPRSAGITSPATSATIASGGSSSDSYGWPCSSGRPTQTGTLRSRYAAIPRPCDGSPVDGGPRRADFRQAASLQWRSRSWPTSRFIRTAEKKQVQRADLSGNEPSASRPKTRRSPARRTRPRRSNTWATVRRWAARARSWLSTGAATGESRRRRDPPRPTSGGGSHCGATRSRTQNPARPDTGLAPAPAPSGTRRVQRTRRAADFPPAASGGVATSGLPDRRPHIRPVEVKRFDATGEDTADARGRTSASGCSVQDT
jgi:hypothetical protein